MRLGSEGAKDTAADATLPVVSTASVKTKARTATDVPGLADALVDALNLLDQIQTAGQDPGRLKVNRGTRRAPVKNKKWNGG